jgi:hypothetical protein
MKAILRTLALASGLAISAAVLAAPALGQAPGYAPPRAVDGKPDLQGVWTNVSLTQLERNARLPALVLTPEQAAQIETARARASAADARPTDPNAPAPPKSSDPGGYNAFWTDGGSHFAKVKGEIRSSWIVDPADGRIPYTPEGRKLFEDSLQYVRTTFDGPETRPMAERCIVGFGSTGGPPMINVLYNNNYQFVQTKDHVVILVEMNHDARIIPLTDTAYAGNSQYLGVSKGRWEGDTLVVTTTNFNPTEQLRTFFAASFYLSTDGVVEERFTRWSDDQILYEFKVTDPKVFAKPWKAEKVFNRSPGQVYEYACHEANYSLPGILAGARRNESLGLTNFADVSE